MSLVKTWCRWTWRSNLGAARNGFVENQSDADGQIVMQMQPPLMLVSQHVVMVQGIKGSLEHVQAVGDAGTIVDG